VRAISIPGAEIMVEEIGDGPVALVLHGGLGLDHQTYRSLDPLASSLRLVYLDHRGNGRSTGDPATATMVQWAADAAAVASDVAGDEPVIVIGHSFGGFIAQEMAISHGAQVRAAILLTTTPGQLGDGEEPVPDGPPMPAEFGEMLSNMPETDEEYAAFMQRLAPAYLHDTPIEVLRDAMRDTVFSAAAMRRGFEELARWSAVDRLHQVTVPVLLVAGRHDAFTAWPQSERIAARLPDAEVLIFEHSGHFPWLEEPDAFFPAIEDWLLRRGLAGS
jgi:proline iminopeptidase